MPPPRRNGKPISSPRHLVLRHGRRILDRLSAKSSVTTNALPKGWQQLYSSDVPGLQAGGYVAVASQEIHASDTKKFDDPVVAQQAFDVFGPRFTLPADAIYSVYPPPGNVVPHEVLPSVVFNDPTMPWERLVETGRSSKLAGVDPCPPGTPLNAVPWMALLVFAPDELKLDESALKAAFRDTSIATSVAQNETLAVETPIDDVLKLNKETVVKLYDNVKDSVAANANVLLVPKLLFNTFFSKYDQTGKQSKTRSPYIAHNKYLAHMRRVNVEGMTAADDHDTETDRDFGILIGNRTGPITNVEPASMIVHLVSLEGVDSVDTFPVALPYVGMISLHSWRYNVQPADAFDLKQTFQRLAATSGMLRAPAAPATPSMSKAEQRVLQRITDGYSLCRYRVQTGEETAAFFRGPLVPTDPVKPDWQLLSTSGSDLHILDKELGMLDITYSSAWNLGRVLGLSDRVFATALTRVRRTIAKEGECLAQEKLLRASGRPFQSRLDLAGTMGGVLQELSSLSKAEVQSMRWAEPVQSSPSLSRRSSGVQHYLVESLQEAASRISSAEVHGSVLRRPYNEFNTPQSVDWAAVHNFVMDLYSFKGVPPQYLLTDPSHVPPESLRFFVVDQAWIDAFVDGALSLGNHSSRDDDWVRKCIKDRINVYLETVDVDLGYRPPVPRLGFVLRSEVVSKFPDLQINVSSKTAAPGDPPKLVRTTQLAEGMLMAFLSEASTGSANEILTFTVPAHQQYFTAAAHLSLKDIELRFKKVYTTASDDNEFARSSPLGDPHIIQRGDKNPDQLSVPFIWGNDDGGEKKAEDIRLVLVENFVQSLYDQLKLAKTGDADQRKMFEEVEPSSALMGIQLNAPAWQLLVNLPELKPPKNWSLLSNRSNPFVSADFMPETRLLKQCVDMKLGNLNGSKDTKLSPRRLPPPHHQGIVDLSKMSRRRSSASSWSVITSHDRTHARANSETSLEIIHDALAPPTTLDTLNWTFRVFTADNRASSTVKMLSERQDLIFSIVIYDENVGDYDIATADITFPAGTTKSLISRYDGPGASMVSNLRYNTRIVQQDGKFRLPILPRSTAGNPPRVSAKRSKEMSVFLPGVRVNKADTEYTVEFTLHFNYVTVPIPDTIPAYIKVVPV